MKIDIGNGTNVRKCTTCKKHTGDFVVIKGKEIPCHLTCYSKLKNRKENKNV